MFDKDKYITSGVQAEIPEQLQAYLWHLINRRREKQEPLDYLQVFSISSTVQDDNKLHIKILHTQEQPPYKQNHTLIIDNDDHYDPTVDKLFCICDGTHSTLLLANEY